MIVRSSRALLSFIAFLALAGVVQAQTFTASLQGTITDASGATVVGAKVTLTNEATKVRYIASPDERGRYMFTLLPPALYRLTVELAGFKTFVRSGMELQVQQQAAVDVVLSPGEISTRVEVVGEAPRLDAASATLGRVVDRKAVLDMPLATRDPLNLTLLAPGVVGAPSNTGTNFVSSGTRNSQSDVLIDGVSVAVQEANGGITDVRLRPTVEIIQEFKVQTNSFSAEYGNTGGTVINMVTRSGTNALHGSLYYFHRNSALNANNFFANRAGRTLVPFRRNQFGGTAGGPLYIPKAYDGRNRTFFYFTHEGTKTSNQTTTLVTVPTLEQRRGDFSKTFDSAGRLIAIYDPYSGRRDASGVYYRDAIPGNAIPAARFNPVAVNAIRYYPEPTSDGVPNTHTNNFFSSGSTRSNSYQSMIKLDHNFNDRHRMSGRYHRTNGTTKVPNLWGNWMNPYDTGDSIGSNNNASIDYTFTVSPTSLLNFRWGVARESARRFAFAEYPEISEFGFQRSLDVDMAPRFNPEGFNSVGTLNSARIVRGQDVNHLVASYSIIAGMHTFKFGGDARLYRLNHAQPGVRYVQFNFDRRTTTRDPFRTDSLQGNGLASMLLGWGSGGGHSVDSYASTASQSYGFYFNDDIQLTPKLTLNLGLRYEYDGPGTERYNRFTWFNLGVKSPISGRVPQFPNLMGGLEFANENQRGAFDVDSNNLAPRAGFAYRFANKMVVRGGYGIYYGITPAGVRKFVGQGFTTSTNWMTSLDSGLTQYAGLANPFPDGLSVPPGSTEGLATFLGRGIGWVADRRDWGTKPYYQQWSVSIERELPANAVVEIAYSGNRGVHLGFGSNKSYNNIDPSYYSLGTKLADLVDNPFYGVITDPLTSLSRPQVSRSQLLRPYPQYTGLSGFSGPPTSNSIYHGGQAKFTKRLSQGLMLSAHYTFSKLIDDSSFMGNIGWLGGTTTLQSYGNLRLERALSVFDVAHRAVLDFAYDLPFGRGKALGGDWNRWMDAVVGGWTVNGILIFQSGPTLQPALSGGILPDATQRPNLIADPALEGEVVNRLNGYLDRNAFSRPAPYTLGTGPRTLSTVRGPGLRNADMSIFKQFYLTGDKARYVQIRGEAFNITNTPRFGSPSMNYGATDFGVISSQANSPRELQVAMKIFF